MYTIGYLHVYGLSLLSRSVRVLVLSMWAHCMQMLFLVLVEAPHMKKVYS